MKEKRIEGFDERIEETIIRSGMSRAEITKKMGASRKLLMPNNILGHQLSALYIARFCAVTKTDANWLLGLTERRKT